MLVRVNIVGKGDLNMDVQAIDLFFDNEDGSVCLFVCLTKFVDLEAPMNTECSNTDPTGMGSLADDANLMELVDETLKDGNTESVKRSACFCRLKGAYQEHFNIHKIEFSGISVEPQEKIEADSRFKADLMRIIDFYLAMEYRISLFN